MNDLYIVIYTYTIKGTKRVVHFCLIPRGHGPQIKQDNVHMKKTSPPSLNMHHSFYYPTYSLFHIFFTSLPSNPDIYFLFITAPKSIFPIMQHFWHHCLGLWWCTTPVYIYRWIWLRTADGMGTFKHEIGRKRRSRRLWTSFYHHFYEYISV